MLVDSHCHLDRLNLDPYDGQLEQALAAAHARDIKQMLCISISLSNVEQVIQIAQQHPSVLASVGVHPCDVSAGTASREQLTEWAGRDKVVAIGETGLDYYHDTDSAKTQDRKSTRLNSSHVRISYAVFCLKKKRSGQSRCI